MEKQNARLLVRHVRVDRHDINSGNSQGLKTRLQFVFANSEISVNNGVVIDAGESNPRVHAHFLVDIYAVHFRGAADGEFNHAVIHFAVHAEDRV